MVLALHAADQKTAEPTPQTTVTSGETATTKLLAAEQQTRLARLEALVLSDQLERVAHEKRAAQEQALAGEACKAAGAEDIAQCALDLSAKREDGSFDLSKAVSKKPVIEKEKK
jgi:hypothetical protein